MRERSPGPRGARRAPGSEAAVAVRPPRGVARNLLATVARGGALAMKKQRTRYNIQEWLLFAKNVADDLPTSEDFEVFLH